MTPSRSQEDLGAALLDAHDRDDRDALVDLYTQAADAASSEVAKGFFLTHAYIFALEAGDPAERTLKDRLIAMGREVP